MARRVLLLFPQLNNFVFFGVYEPLVLEIFSAIAKEEGCDLREIGIFAIPHILISPEMTAPDFDDIYKFIEENEFEYPVAIPLTPLPGTQNYATFKAQGRIITDKLDFYTFMYNVIRPTHMSPREYDRLYDRLIFRRWSWSKYLRGKCGRTSFLAFLKWWVFVRLLVLKLRWRRREIYRAAEQQAALANRAAA
jgi:hypothetical protein